MLKVAEEIRGSFEFNLGDLQKKLENVKYYGTITIVLQKGKIVLIKEERIVKPGEISLSLGF